MLVVMNADGSAGVSVDARIGATVPALGGLAWGLLGAGLFCLLIGVVLLVLAIRRPVRPAGRLHRRCPRPVPAGPAAGPDAAGAAGPHARRPPPGGRPDRRRPTRRRPAERDPDQPDAARHGAGPAVGGPAP